MEIANYGLRITNEAGDTLFEVNPNATSTATAVVRAGTGDTSALEVVGGLTLTEGTLQPATSTDALVLATSTDLAVASTPDTTSVTLKVIRSEAEGIKLVVSSGAEFLGTILVRDARVNGSLVVKGDATFEGKLRVVKGVDNEGGDLALEGNLELGGAIVRIYEEAPGEALLIGDAVGIVGAKKVGRVLADSGIADSRGQYADQRGSGFRPAIGLVVGFIDADVRGNDTQTYAEDNSGQRESASSQRQSARLVKVAVGGAVGGFAGLEPGVRYWLSDTMTYTERAYVRLNSTTEAALPQSLMSQSPSQNGNAAQIMALAEDESTLLLLPSLDWRVVGTEERGKDYTEIPGMAPVNVYQYTIEKLELNTGDTQNESTEGGTEERGSDNAAGETGAVGEGVSGETEGIQSTGDTGTVEQTTGQVEDTDIGSEPVEGENTPAAGEVTGGSEPVTPGESVPEASVLPQEPLSTGQAPLESQPLTGQAAEPTVSEAAVN